MGPNSNVPPKNYDASAIAAWHKAHDAEVKQLTTELNTPACALPPAPVPPNPYDLLYSEIDDNGAPLDPYWKSTVTAPFFSAPTPSQCGNENPWQTPCTGQLTTINNDKGLCPTGALGGHANWFPATYVGRLTWESHSLESQDDDYNFGLLPLIPQMPTPWITAEDDPVAGLHMEFSSDETIDHFKTPWWQSFHDAVDSDDSRSIDNPFGDPRREMVSGTSHALAMINGNYAIVIGLVGLDCAHSCGAEIHPVWAIAIHVKDDPTDDVWAFFARNQGNEGYCGPKSVELNTQSFVFRLPWRAGATDVNLAGQNFRQHPKPLGGSFDARPDENALLITFLLDEPGKGGWINGEIHLAWQGPAQRIFLPPAAMDQAISQRPEKEDDDERNAAVAFSKLTPQQRASIVANLPRPDPAADTQEAMTLSRGHSPQPKPTIPTISLTSDARGNLRSAQRISAIKAASAMAH